MSVHSLVNGSVNMSYDENDMRAQFYAEASECFNEVSLNYFQCCFLPSTFALFRSML